MKRILVAFGTRPEVIKLAPVIRELRTRSDHSVIVCATGQHREMAHQALDAFGLTVDVQFDAMSSGASLAHLTSHILRDMDALIERESPDWVIVQGDTTSAMATAMCAFYRRVGLGHVEAGLRTGNRWGPFPEEINRTIIGHVADLHFAPTQRAAENLLKVGVPMSRIHVTGNTVVDALMHLAPRLAHEVPAGLDPSLPAFIDSRRLVLVTSHRRESFGEGLDNVCRALLATVERYSDAVVIYPVHLNPNVHVPVHAALQHHPRIRLMEPVAYLPLLWLISRSFLILTDSGGIQEEAPSFKKPVLVLRAETERPEGIEAGCARIVGTNRDLIVSAVTQLFESASHYEAMTRARNPYGDGMAAQRIVKILSEA